MLTWVPGNVKTDIISYYQAIDVHGSGDQVNQSMTPTLCALEIVSWWSKRYLQI